MFTGLVSDIGTIASIESGNDVVHLAIDCGYPAEGIALGASIACSGICLTVTSVEAGEGGRTRFHADLGPETLAVTNAAGWRVGRRLNLERSLRIGDELGGHLVSGHVDGVAIVLARDEIGETVRFTFEAPGELARFIAVKGSVALDGTSLTVNTVEGNRFSCLLIPHTLAVTTWGGVRAGDSVNLEVDQMARYAARLAEASAPR